MSNYRNQYPFNDPGYPYAPIQPGAPSAQSPTGYVAQGPGPYGPGHFPPATYPQGGMGNSQPVRQQGPGNPMQYPQGNTFQDAFLAERTPGEMARLDALAREAGETLGPQTILRPFLYPASLSYVRQNSETVTENQNADFVLTYYFPFAAFIRKITASLNTPVLNAGFEDALTGGPFTGDVSALDYIEGKLERQNQENIFVDYIPLSQWCGTGQLAYVFDLIPFVARGETLRIPVRIPKIVPPAGGAAIYPFDYIGQICITLHAMRFPAP
jgi:hypothetical protein